MLLATGGTMEAQTATSPFEAGMQGSLLRFSQPTFDELPFPPSPAHHDTIFGPGGYVDWNVSRLLAIEAAAEWYPRHFSPLLYPQEGGRTVQFHAGPRISIYRGERWSLFATIQPGLVRFTHECIPIATPPAIFTCSFAPVKNFALLLGGGVEAYPTRRLVVRFDVQDGTIAMYDRSASIRQSPNFIASVSLPGGMQPSLRMALGIGYRLGTLRDEPQQVIRINPQDARVEVGGQFGSLTKGNSLDLSFTGNQVNTGMGGGGWFAYNLPAHLAIDGSLMYFPNHSGRLVNFQSGGNAIEGLFGVKAGFRRVRFGYFAKARPGFLHFDQTLDHFFSGVMAPAQLPFTPITHAVLDVGGVIEVYTSRHTMLRFDAGDTIWRIGSREVVGLLPQPTLAPEDVRHTIQLTSGFGLRF